MALGNLALGILALGILAHWVFWNWVLWHWVLWYWVYCPDTVQNYPRSRIAFDDGITFSNTRFELVGQSALMANSFCN